MRGATILLVLLGILSPGCLDTGDAVRPALGRPDSTAHDGAAVYYRTHVEGRFVVGGQAQEWSSEPRADHPVSRRLEKSDLSDGGGVEVQLAPTDVHLELRLKDPTWADGLTARWTVAGTYEELGMELRPPGAAYLTPPRPEAVACEDRKVPAGVRAPAHEAASVAMTRYGMHLVLVELFQESRRVAFLCEGMPAYLALQAEIRSEIFPGTVPSRPKGQDTFTIPLGFGAAPWNTTGFHITNVTAGTQRATAWQPSQGNHLGLAMGPSQAPSCRDAEPVLDPGRDGADRSCRASHVVGRTEIVRVGAVTGDAYANVGPIPYVLRVASEAWIRYDA